MKLLPALCLLPLLATSALAQGSLAPGDEVEAYPGQTYADLLRQVLPDLAQTDTGWTGTLPKPLEHIEGDDRLNDPPETIEIASISAQPVRSNGADTLWVLADLGPGEYSVGDYTILAAFDAAGKLLDAVEVDTDRFTGFDGAPLAISSRDEAMGTYSTHFNSEQSYLGQDLIFLHDGKLSLLASFFTLNVHSCYAYNDEELTLSSSPSNDRYWPVGAAISRESANVEMPSDETADAPPCFDPDAAPETRHSEYAGIYRWNESGAAYETDSTAFDQLQSENEAMF